MNMNNTADVVITGHWDGQPIWRRRTANEKLEVILWEKSKTKPMEEAIILDKLIEAEAHAECGRCHGTGEYPVADGPDDVMMIECGHERLEVREEVIH